jgi:CTP synthase
VSERHRHRYEVNNDYRDRIAESGLRILGHLAGRPPGGVRRIPAEVHPFIVGTQAHPELKSRPDPAAPAVRRLHRGCHRLQGAERLPVEMPEHSSNGNQHRKARSGRYLSPQPVAEHLFETASTETLHVGKIFALRSDKVQMPGGRTART